MTIKLESVEFTGAPTKTQLGNAIRDFRNFLNKAAGAMMAEGHHTAHEQFMGSTLNMAVQLKALEDIFDGNSNLAVPQQGNGPRVVR